MEFVRGVKGGCQSSVASVACSPSNENAFYPCSVKKAIDVLNTYE